MKLFKNSGDLASVRRVLIGMITKSEPQYDQNLRSSRRGRRFARIYKRRLFCVVFSVVVIFTIYLAIFGLTIHSNGREVQDEFTGDYLMEQPRKKPRHRPRFPPCDVPFAHSVSYMFEPKKYINFTQFSSSYVEYEKEEFPQHRFGGHQTIEEREKSFYATNQTIHCGFVKGSEEFPSTGFDLSEEDKKYMSTCKVAVSSCIFGSSDFLRRPTSRLISDFSKKNVCFVMFVDEQTLTKISAEGNVPDDRGFVGLWKSHKEFFLDSDDKEELARYSIWLDSKLRLNADPMLIIEYFLWRGGSEYAISNHYTRHCVWDEVLQNKRLNKYNHTAIDEQFQFYQADGLVKFDRSDPNIALPSFVPEGSFIVRAHTPMSNLFSCLWFNEVDRFTSRDQLSFAYTFLKLSRTNPSKPFHLHMFKDCERRALVKLFHHREPSSPTVKS
ncbi:hypothetical protein Leryth_002234 [Lithospermum erythrorhizon]|nr:hypothetical protein Leryth_002234 [Lithospermum erythrorhizon]